MCDRKAVVFLLGTCDFNWIILNDVKEICYKKWLGSYLKTTGNLVFFGERVGGESSIPYFCFLWHMGLQFEIFVGFTNDIEYNSLNFLRKSGGL